MSSTDGNVDEVSGRAVSTTSAYAFAKSENLDMSVGSPIGSDPKPKP